MSLESQMMHAALSGNTSELKEAIQEGANINLTFFELSGVLECSLHLASKYGCTKCAIILLEAGALDGKELGLPRTAYDVAMEWGNTETAEAIQAFNERKILLSCTSDGRKAEGDSYSGRTAAKPRGMRI